MAVYNPTGSGNVHTDRAISGGRGRVAKAGGSRKGMGFKAAAASVAKRQGISQQAANAIIAAGARKASPAAKKANPNLKKVGTPRKSKAMSDSPPVEMAMPPQLAAALAKRKSPAKKATPRARKAAAVSSARATATTTGSKAYVEPGTTKSKVPPGTSGAVKRSAATPLTTPNMGRC